MQFEHKHRPHVKRPVRRRVARHERPPVADPLRDLGRIHDAQHQGGAALNRPFQEYLLLLCTERDAASIGSVRRAALDVLLAPAMIWHGSLPCGHPLYLPGVSVRQPGRHLYVPWLCLACGDAYLLDVRTRPLPEIVVRVCALPEIVHTLYTALVGPELDTWSGCYFKCASDDATAQLPALAVTDECGR